MNLSSEEIKIILRENPIDKNFKYLDDANILYQIMKTNPEIIDKLVPLLDYNIGARITKLLHWDKNKTKEFTKVLFKKLFTFYDNIPHEYADFIESEEEYIKLVDNSLDNFIKLHNTKNKFQQKEEQLFYELFEHNYTYNPEYPISYAQKSPIVLLNTLKRSHYNIYYITFFDKEAFDEDVINYIKDNNLLINIKKEFINEIPALTLLKLKIEPNYWTELSSYGINDEILNYLLSINFNSEMVNNYIKETGNIPNCLNNLSLMMILLNESLDNIKYYNGEITTELTDYLIKNDYLYRKNDNPNLLQNHDIFLKFLNEGDLSILLKNNIFLEEDQIIMLATKLVETKKDYSYITNSYLQHNTYFYQILASDLNIDNQYNLEPNELITSLGRSLSILSKIFNDNEIQIIIREIIKNNYHIDMTKILENIDINKYQLLYNKLVIKENKFNHNFNFYYFIKINDYLSNNLTLLKDLNNLDIDHINEDLLNNLTIAINNNDYINYEELLNYQSIYKNKVSKEPCSIKDKIFKLMFNSNENDINYFINNIINSKKLIYLQLEFCDDQYASKVLDSYLNVITIMENVLNNKVDLNKLYASINEHFNLNSLFDIKNMQENLLRLYAILYKKETINKDELSKKGKKKIINNCEIYDITGEEFILFTHTENFNNQEDFTSSDEYVGIRRQKNYLCTSFTSYLFPYGLENDNMQIFELNNPNSLIAFGNKDIFIKYKNKAPLIEAENVFVNPFDMAFFNKRGYTPTEFDFLRYDDLNNQLHLSYLVVSNREKAETYANNIYNNQTILIFDKQKHYHFLENKKNNLINNLDNLTWKEIYELIALSKIFPLDTNIIENIINKINTMNEKEQIVLYDALEKYNIDVKTKNNRK